MSIEADDPCDVEVIDRLAHLVLVTKELGWSVARIWVRADLEELLEFAGLARLCDTHTMGRRQDRE